MARYLTADDASAFDYRVLGGDQPVKSLVAENIPPPQPVQTRTVYLRLKFLNDQIGLLQASTGTSEECAKIG